MRSGRASTSCPRRSRACPPNPPRLSIRTIPSPTGRTITGLSARSPTNCAPASTLQTLRNGGASGGTTPAAIASRSRRARTRSRRRPPRPIPRPPRRRRHLSLASPTQRRARRIPTPAQRHRRLLHLPGHRRRLSHRPAAELPHHLVQRDSRCRDKSRWPAGGAAARPAPRIAAERAKGRPAAARESAAATKQRQCGAGSAVLLTNAILLPSGDHDGTLIVPCPPYSTRSLSVYAPSSVRCRK